MKHRLIIFIIFFYSFCKSFAQDTTINRAIILQNSTSITNLFGNLMEKINKESDIPEIYIKSKNGSQYLKLLFYPGSTNNEFSFFEVSAKAPKNTKNVIISKFDTFKTESDIFIGISKKRLISIKGKKYVKKGSFNTSTLTYRTSDSLFLKRYNMPSYIAKYEFKNDILVKFSFGFDYP